QVKVSDRADVRVDADEKWLRAVLPLLEVRLQFHALDELRCGIGDVHKHVRERNPRGVALPGGGGIAGLQLRHEVDANNKNCQQESNAGKEQNSGGLHRVNSGKCDWSPAAATTTTPPPEFSALSPG